MKDFVSDSLGTARDLGLGAGIPLGIVAGLGYLNVRHNVGKNFLTGAFLSAGADPLESGKIFKGSVFAFGEHGGDILKNTVRGYGSTVTFGGGAKSYMSFGGVTEDLFTPRSDVIQKGGLSKLHPLNMVAPALFTGIGTVNAMMDGGISGGVEYLVQDAMGMAAANHNLNQVYKFDVGNAKQVAAVEAHFGLKSGELTKSAGGKSTGFFNVQRTAFGSPLAAQMLAIGGGILGAGAGMAAGRYAGETIGKSLGYGESAYGFLGAAFGGMTGAHIGAMMTASPARLAISAAGIAATTIVAKGTYAMLESGFRKEKMRHSKGLNFASDTSQFMTQQAVTMRQRAMQAMHKSHLNARSAFGQEATISHMNRDMFSHYKR